MALGEAVAERQHAYRELFRHPLEDDVLHEIREALNHELVVGRSYFKDEIEAITKRQTRLGEPGCPRVGEELGVYRLAYQEYWRKMLSAPAFVERLVATRDLGGDSAEV